MSLVLLLIVWWMNVHLCVFCVYGGEYICFFVQFGFLLILVVHKYDYLCTLCFCLLWWRIYIKFVSLCTVFMLNLVVNTLCIICISTYSGGLSICLCVYLFFRTFWCTFYEQEKRNATSIYWLIFLHIIIQIENFATGNEVINRMNGM